MAVHGVDVVVGNAVLGLSVAWEVARRSPRGRVRADHRSQLRRDVPCRAGPGRAARCGRRRRRTRPRAVACDGDAGQCHSQWSAWKPGPGFSKTVCARPTALIHTGSADTGCQAAATL